MDSRLVNASQCPKLSKKQRHYELMIKHGDKKLQQQLFPIPTIQIATRSWRRNMWRRKTAGAIRWWRRRKKSWCEVGIRCLKRMSESHLFSVSVAVSTAMEFGSSTTSKQRPYFRDSMVRAGKTRRSSS